MKDLIAKLHPLERKVLPHLKDSITSKEVEKLSQLSEVEVNRAILWLEAKDVLKTDITLKEFVELDKNALKYKKDGLPEKKFLTIVKSEKTIQEIRELNTLESQEINVCIGSLKRSNAIEMNAGKIIITQKGKELLSNETPEEAFLKLQFPLFISTLTDEQKNVLAGLKKRKEFIITNTKKTTKIILTETGKNLQKEDLNIELADSLTSEMLKTRNWENITFRSYDVTSNVPSMIGGKRHFVNQAVDYIKQIWIELGFEEMQGNSIHTSFWDLDCLFVPQDHPARAMQDTFYIKDPNTGELPKWKNDIKNIHENGADTGSTGWGGKWSEDEAKKLLLRTHTTVLSAEKLKELKEEDLPKKYFAIGKVYRNEALDWKHLFEFYQVEGIVVDKNANMKHLKGYLREFYKKMGYTDVRLRPAHFPYTEPSVEVEVYHPQKKQWVELGGAGIFRPEVTKALLGFECPVLAWGQGMARIIAEYWKITDIRDLYKNDIKQIREMKFWMK